MVHEVFERGDEKNKNAAPTDCCSTSVDQKERIEPAVADAVVDERRKSPRTVIGAENAYHGRGLVFGLLFWCTMAAAFFVLVGTIVLPKRSGSADFQFSRIDEAKPRTAITLISPPKGFPYPAPFGLRGAYMWEHAHAWSDEQRYRTPAIMRAVGWRIFNIRRTLNVGKWRGLSSLTGLVKLIRECLSGT